MISNCRYFLADIPGEFNITAIPFGCSANLSWNAPIPNGCPITRYTIHFRNERSGWNMINLQRSNVKDYRLRLNCSENYYIMVFAWNQRGHNDYSWKSVLSVPTENGNSFGVFLLMTDLLPYQNNTM